METLATIAIASIGVMLILIFAFGIYILGGFQDIFSNKKHNS